MPMTRHEVAVLDALSGGEWLPAAELARRAQVAPRTARAYASRLHAAGYTERIEVGGGHYHRLRRDITEHAPEYCDRLRIAAHVLGESLNLPSTGGE